MGRCIVLQSLFVYFVCHCHPYSSLISIKSFLLLLYCLFYESIQCAAHNEDNNSVYSLRWWVSMNIINKDFFALSISLFLYCTEATGFSHTILWSAPPNIKKISHQQLTFGLKLLCVELRCLWQFSHVRFAFSG